MVVMHRRTRFGIRMETVYFARGTEPYRTDADLVLFAFAAEDAVTVRNRRLNWSIQLDLSPDEEQLLEGTNVHLRKELRKALREGASLRCEVLRHPTDAQIQAYAGRQDAFSHRQRADAVDLRHLAELAERDMLAILHVLSPEGGILAGCSLWICADRAYGLHAFSTFRRFTEPSARRRAGTATKRMYWQAVLLAKREHCRVFDFGLAIHARHDPQGHLRGIDSLKYEFGARPVKEFDFYKACTWKGRLILPLLLLSKWRPFDRYEPVLPAVPPTVSPGIPSGVPLSDPPAGSPPPAAGGNAAVPRRQHAAE